MTSMTKRRTAVSIAAGGVAAGVAGLVLLAVPAGAGEAPPELPEISAAELVESVLTTEAPAAAGTVEVQNNLGLPMPAAVQTTDGVARVYSDGEGRGRISLPQESSEKTIVADGNTVWIWDSGARSVRKIEHDGTTAPPMAGQLTDPAAVARELVNAMEADSTVMVDGTARVADRAAYQLVLTPKPTERTLLREVRLAVDAELRVPLRLDVLANGQADPALRIGFTEFEPGPQDASLFEFTPPPGAKVIEESAEVAPEKERKAVQDATTTVGRGWDTVLVADASDVIGAPAGDRRADGAEAGGDPTAILEQLGTEVRGPYGRGWLIESTAGSALITEDGRLAIGAVPQQVLVEALGKVK